LRELVAAAAAAGGASAEEQLRRLRDLTLAFQAVRDAMRPIAGAFGPPVGEGSGAVLQILSDCLYFAEELAMSPPETAGAAAAVAPTAKRSRI
jgi:hypothetical protein